MDSAMDKDAGSWPGSEDEDADRTFDSLTYADNFGDSEPTKEELKEISEEEEEEEIIDPNTLADSFETMDPVRLYLKDVGKVNLLTRDEETELAKTIADGREASEQLEEDSDIDDATRAELEKLCAKGEAAKEKMIEANFRLVGSIAKRYYMWGMDFEDLKQEGNLGLIKAVEKFDYSRGCKFSTYATWWIRQSITRAIAYQARTIRLPENKIQEISNMLRVSKQLEQELGCIPSPEEIAEKMNKPVDEVRVIKEIAQYTFSLDTPIGDEEDSPTVGDTISDENASDLGKEASDSEIQNQDLETLASFLTPLEYNVIKMEMGFNEDNEVLKRNQVAYELGIKADDVRRIEDRAKKKMNRPGRAERIKNISFGADEDD